MSKLEEVMAAPGAAKETYLALVAKDAPMSEVRAASDAVKAAQQALAAFIVDGCKPCPSCGGQPHGMVQVWTIEKEVVTGFEIGCPRCYDHIAVGYLAEELEQRLAAARGKWNAGKFYIAAGAAAFVKIESGEVFLVSRESKADRISCKVVEPTEADVLAKAERVRVKADEPLVESDFDHARQLLFKERVAARDARVKAFRDRVGGSEREVLTVA